MVSWNISKRFLDLFYLCLFFLGLYPQHIEFPGQGSDPSRSCDPNHSCGTAGSLTHCAGLGIKPVTWHSQDATDKQIFRKSKYSKYCATAGTTPNLIIWRFHVCKFTYSRKYIYDAQINPQAVFLALHRHTQRGENSESYNAHIPK